MIGNESLTDEVDLVETGTDAIRKERRLVAFVLLDGGSAFAAQADQRADDKRMRAGSIERSLPERCAVRRQECLSLSRRMRGIVRLGPSWCNTFLRPFVTSMGWGLRLSLGA